MRVSLGLAALLVLVVPTAVACEGCAAGDLALVDTPPERQLEIFHQMAAKTVLSSYDTDADGNITYVAFVHSKYAKDTTRPAERVVRNDPDSDLPRLDDADFRMIRHFPKLTGLTVQFQTISEEGYAVLRSFPELRVAALKNIKTGFKAAGLDQDAVTDSVFMHLDDARRLEVFDTTHTFGMSSREEQKTLSRMQGFPELKVLIVDVGHADDFDELFPFIQKCPKIEWLKLHRCTFSDAQMQQILDALPELERLEMKPRGNTPGERWSPQSLRLVAEHPGITHLRLIHGDALPLPWEDGLAHLAADTSLEVIEWPGSKDPAKAVSAQAISRLQEARPDLVITPTLEHRERRALWNRVEAELNPVDYYWRMGPN